MYDQDPEFVSDMFYILTQVNRAQNEKMEEQTKTTGKGKNKGLLGHPSRVRS